MSLLSLCGVVHLQGLGLVVTGTMPVFNLTVDGNSQVTLSQ